VQRGLLLHRTDDQASAIKAERVVGAAAH
jgi:hypothetical protein